MRQTDTGLLLGTTHSLTLPKKVIYLLVRARTSPKLVRWAFLLFVFTIPFENIDVEALRGVASVSRVAGLLFFSTCLLYPKVCFRRPPQAWWWFAGYGFIYVLSGLGIPEQFVGPFIIGLQAFIQMLVLCWIGSSLLQEEKLARHTLLTFSIATLLLATGMFLGLPGFSKMSGGRMSAAGFNPNGLAVFMALGAQALLEFGIEQTLRNIWMRATFMAMSLFLLMAMVYTGSRGGIIAGMAGVALYALPHCKSKRKMAAILGATIAVVGVVYITVNDQSTLSRFELTYDTGNTAGRDMIYASAIEMIAEKPLLGWGPIVWWYELGRRTASPYITRDAHNLFLHLLLDGGLLGAMPFLIGFGLCVQAAWTARGHSLGLLPLVWSTTMIVASMSATMGGKILWLVLTFNLASGASTIKQYKRKNLVIRTILQHLSQRDISHTKDIHT